VHASAAETSSAFVTFIFGVFALMMFASFALPMQRQMHAYYFLHLKELWRQACQLFYYQLSILGLINSLI